VLASRESVLFRCRLARAALSEAQPDSSFELSDEQHAALQVMIEPDQDYMFISRYDMLARLQFYKPLREGRYEPLLRAVEVTAEQLRIDPDTSQVLVGNHYNEQAILRLLAMITDMPNDTSIDHRLLIWQKVVETDELLVAESPGLLGEAVERMHEVDSRLVNRASGVMNAAASQKLHKLSQIKGLLRAIGASPPLTPSQLRFGDYTPNSPYSIISESLPQALMIYEALSILLQFGVGKIAKIKALEDKRPII
jgi:hypothetical protein